MKLIRHLRDRRNDHFRRLVRARDVRRAWLRAIKLSARVSVSARREAKEATYSHA